MHFFLYKINSFSFKILQTETNRLLLLGHHIGSRSHVIEREQNTISGDQEERQEFINLEEEEAEDFNREFEQKARESFHGHSIARRHSGLPQITSGSNATGAGG